MEPVFNRQGGGEVGAQWEVWSGASLHCCWGFTFPILTGSLRGEPTQAGAPSREVRCSLPTWMASPAAVRRRIPRLLVRLLGLGALLLLADGKLVSKLVSQLGAHLDGGTPVQVLVVLLLTLDVN